MKSYFHALNKDELYLLACLLMLVLARIIAIYLRSSILVWRTYILFLTILLV